MEESEFVQRRLRMRIEDPSALLNNMPVAAEFAALEEPVLHHAVGQQVEQKEQHGKEHHSADPKQDVADIKLGKPAPHASRRTGLGMNQHRDPPFHPGDHLPAQGAGASPTRSAIL
jgi:hypothetical protein